MKILMLVLGLMPLVAVGQVEPCKKCNTIVVSTSVSPDESYKLAAKTFALKGYPIDHSDLGSMTISTKEKVSGNLMLIFVRLNSVVIEHAGKGVIYLRGEYHTGDGLFVPVSNKGMKGSPALKAWEYMQEAAFAFSKAEFSYMIQ